MSAQEVTPLEELPWYESLQKLLAPYAPATLKDADTWYSSAEIIASLEEHFGVPQGPVGKEVTQFVYAADFVRAMHALGYEAANTGGIGLQWMLKKK